MPGAIRVSIVQNTLAGYNIPLFVRLARQGYALSVAAHSVDTDGLARLAALQSAVERLDIVPRRTGQRFITSRTAIAPPSIRLLRVVAQWQPHVVVVDGLSSVGNALTLGQLVRWMGAGFVWWSLGEVRNSPHGARKTLGDRLQRLGTRRAVVLSYGSHAATYFRRIGVPESRVVVGCNTIDETVVLDRLPAALRGRNEMRRALSIAPDETVVVGCGTLKPGKKFDVLVRAFAELRSTGPKSTLLIIGDGPDRRSLENLVDTLGLKQQVRFVGARTKDITDFFVVGDFAVLPGLGGLAIPHAFAHGLPVVCGPADGTELDFVVPNETGILLESVTVDSLVRAMRTLVRDPSGRAAMGRRAQRLVSADLSIETYARRFSDAIRLSLQSPHIRRQNQSRCHQ